MRIWLYPFTVHYLRTPLGRKGVQDELLKLTFLSDEGFRKPEGTRSFFYGTVASEDFDLETIAEEKRLAAYISGRIKGVGEDLFVQITLKSFRVRRWYLLLLGFLLFASGYHISGLISRGLSQFGQPAFLLLSVVIASLWIYVIRECRTFWRVQKNSLDFFRGLFRADTVRYNDIPVIFRI